MAFKIPESEKPFLGLRLGNGTNYAFTIACEKMGVNRSEFARYCILRTLQELSLVSQHVKTPEEKCPVRSDVNG